jgi:hypothetical protein
VPGRAIAAAPPRYASFIADPFLITVERVVMTSSTGILERQGLRRETQDCCVHGEHSTFW